MQAVLTDLYETTTKDGEKKYRAVVLAPVSDYGTIKNKTFEIEITPEEYSKLLQFKGKMQPIEVDVVLPLPQFPLQGRILGLNK